MLDTGWVQKTNGNAVFSGKSLFQMREVGIDKVLHYRTKQFDSYCKGYLKTSEISLVDVVMKWWA